MSTQREVKTGLTNVPFRIRTSNHLDYLLQDLVERITLKPLPPMEQEWVAVPSSGMRRWLTLRLASKIGVAGSLFTPFPEGLFHRIIERLNPVQTEETLFWDRKAVMWWLFRELPKLMVRERFAPIRTYLEQDPQQRKRFQLAFRLANLYDDYQVYRPEMLDRWETNQASAQEPSQSQWQAALWRQMTAHFKGGSRHHYYRELKKSLSAESLKNSRLPNRIFLFGISSLPPLFTSLLASLSRHIEVVIYLFHPGGNQHENTPSRSLDSEIQGKPNRSTQSSQATKHPLMAAMGKQSEEFLHSLANSAHQISWQPLENRLPEGDSMLAVLQRDIAQGLDYFSAKNLEQLPVSREDRSLQIHRCHSPKREMEVLRDHLLEAFSNNKNLKPYQVLVMVPDIRLYTPFIQAVFAVEQEGTPHLPFAIADRTVGQEQPLTATVLQIFDVAAGRLTATEVLGLLEEPLLRKRFGITEQHLPVLRDWLDRAPIRWGRDGSHRQQEFGLPKQEEHSWRTGLDRLLMGYVAGNLDDLVVNIRPLPMATNSYLDLLGGFTEFAETLFEFGELLAGNHKLSRWSEILTDLIAAFFDSGGDTEEYTRQFIADALEDMKQKGQDIAGDVNISSQVIKAYLEGLFDQEGFGNAFITGRITFGALKPMRTIPYQIVCISGLNDGVFPRPGSVPTFNLMARNPLPGDRSPGNDDRQLFLETLMAAQQRLILTYEGYDSKDLSPKAPSSVITDLQEVIELRFALTREPGQPPLTCHHPLQPFDPKYFSQNDAGLFSYSLENYRASQVVPHLESSPFLQADLPATEEDETIDINDLLAFWHDPCRFFCKHVLNLNLLSLELEAQDAEPFLLTSLDRYHLKTQILDYHLSKIRADERTYATAAGLLPPGQLAAPSYDLEREATKKLIGKIEALEKPNPQWVQVKGDHWEVAGHVDLYGDGTQYLFRPSTIGPKDRIAGWIRHLVLNAWAANSGNRPIETQILGTEGRSGPTSDQLHLLPLQGALPLLDPLVRGYREGLRQPPPFFPKSSFVYAQAHFKQLNSARSKANPMNAVRTAWEGNSFMKIPGESQDAFVKLCFRGRNPFAEEAAEFSQWALRFWMPLFDHSAEAAR